MKINKTKIPGVFILEPHVFTDERGTLIEAFREDIFLELGLVYSFKQSLCSINKKDVVRGMHFQVPPKSQVKIVYATRGAVTDVVLDLRKGSPTYGQHIKVELSEKNHQMVYIPSGCAHGFCSLEEDSTIIYLQDIPRSVDHERGVNLESFGMDWEIEKPIISKKDQGLPSFEEYDSPFLYEIDQ